MVRRLPHIRKARTLRRWMTHPEDVLWQALRNRQVGGFKFRRKSPLEGRIVDFYCPEARLVVEVSGPAQHRVLNAAKDAALVAAGHGIIRVTREQIMDSLPDVLSSIRRAAEHRKPHPMAG